jgi:hypothetical protein
MVSGDTVLMLFVSGVMGVSVFIEGGEFYTQGKSPVFDRPNG